LYHCHPCYYKKTAAAKRAAVTAKNAAAKARATLAASKAKARDAEKTLKEHVNLAEIERKMEEAKAAAVARFLAKWESDFARKAAKKKRAVKKKRSVKRKPSTA